MIAELNRFRDKAEEQFGKLTGELVPGDTDSELVFALITAYARQDGDRAAPSSPRSAG